MKDRYILKTELMLREGKARLNRLRAAAEKDGVARLDARRSLNELEARFAEVNRHFEALQAPGVKGIADIKVGLEKAWQAFTELEGKP